MEESPQKCFSTQELFHYYDDDDDDDDEACLVQMQSELVENLN